MAKHITFYTINIYSFNDCKWMPALSAKTEPNVMNKFLKLECAEAIQEEFYTIFGEEGPVTNLESEKFKKQIEDLSFKDYSSFVIQFSTHEISI